MESNTIDLLTALLISGLLFAFVIVFTKLKK